MTRIYAHVLIGGLLTYGVLGYLQTLYQISDAYLHHSVQSDQLTGGKHSDKIMNPTVACLTPFSFSIVCQSKS